MSSDKSLNLTPGESLFLMNPELARPRDLLNITFADLLLKKAIKAEIQKKEILFLESKTIYVSAGESYSQMKFKLHERVILDHVSLSSKELGQLARELHKTLEHLYSFRNDYLRDPLVWKGYFRAERRNFFGMFPHTRYVLTEKGREVQDRIWILHCQAKNLDKLVEKGPARAKAYLALCKSNALLLQPSDWEVVRRLSKELEMLDADFSSY